jgi:hypothetical protein
VTRSQQRVRRIDCLALGNYVNNVCHAFRTDSNNKQNVVWFYGFQFVPTLINEEDVLTAAGVIP